MWFVWKITATNIVPLQFRSELCESLSSHSCCQKGFCFCWLIRLSLQAIPPYHETCTTTFRANGRLNCALPERSNWSFAFIIQLCKTLRPKHKYVLPYADNTIHTCGLISVSLTARFKSWLICTRRDPYKALKLLTGTWAASYSDPPTWSDACGC